MKFRGQMVKQFFFFKDITQYVVDSATCQDRPCLISEYVRDSATTYFFMLFAIQSGLFT